MATYKEEHCTVCLKHLPKSSTRRKLNSESTKHVVPVLREVAGRNFRAELVSILLPDSDDTFLCRQCFRNAEKLQQLRRELLGLECKLVDLLKQSKLQLGLGPDVDVELETAPSAAPHTPTASEGSPKPGLQHPSTPLRVSARKRRTLDSGHVAQLPACSATGSPGQPPPTKRRALDTPSREFMQQAHVASSPSVAVSL